MAEETDGGGWELFVADYGTWLVIGLLVAAIALIAYYSVLQVIVNRKANLKVLAGAGMLLAVYIVAWLISPYDFKWSDLDKGVSPTGSGFIGGAIITVYILLGSAFAAIAFFEFKRVFKK